MTSFKNTVHVIMIIKLCSTILQIWKFFDLPNPIKQYSSLILLWIHVKMFQRHQLGSHLINIANPINYD